MPDVRHFSARSIGATLRRFGAPQVVALIGIGLGLSALAPTLPAAGLDRGPETRPAANTASVVAAPPEAATEEPPDYVFVSSEEPETVPVPIPGSELVRGRSTITVAAPIDKVRAAVLDFPHYAEFMPHYAKCKLLGRTAGGARDVYMEVSALHGAVTMWARVAVQKPKTVDGVEMHEARFVEGNVKQLAATWRLKKLDNDKTELSLEIFLDPAIPLPKKVINHENLDGSADGVRAMKARAEKG